ncbi:hypothetical protein ACIPRI_23495 [Variovorax sp. LARHSF232]
MNEPSDTAETGPKKERRELLHRIWAVAAVSVASGSATFIACGGGSGGQTTSAAATGAVPGPAPAPGADPAMPADPSSPPPPPPPAPGTAPALGAHALSFNRDEVSTPALVASGLSTSTSGSTLLACVGRGLFSADIPTDSAGNVFVQLGVSHTYALWPKSGTALFACEKAQGMAGHVVSVVKPIITDETTMSVVEVTGGGLVRDVQWREVLSGQPLTSASVTTTGPAVLVAWWWGDAGVEENKTAVADNGFTVIDSILESGSLVQCAVAVRQVGAAGSYNVTWTATPQQGAQLWLVAVQAA